MKVLFFWSGESCCVAAAAAVAAPGFGVAMALEKEETLSSSPASASVGGGPGEGEGKTYALHPYPSSPPGSLKLRALLPAPPPLRLRPSPISPTLAVPKTLSLTLSFSSSFSSSPSSSFLLVFTLLRSVAGSVLRWLCRNFCEMEFVFAPLGPLCSTLGESRDSANIPSRLLSIHRSIHRCIEGGEERENCRTRNESRLRTIKKFVRGEFFVHDKSRPRVKWMDKARKNPRGKILADISFSLEPIELDPFK